MSDHHNSSSTVLPTADSLKTKIGNAHKKAILYMSRHQNLSKGGKEGWWPYKVGSGPSIEATAWCALAMQNDESVTLNALQYLVSNQNTDGGWSTAPLEGMSDWCSALAVLALRLIPSIHNYPAKVNATINDKIKRALGYLFESRTEFYRPVARLLIFLMQGAEGLQYGRGWPWTHDCFHWVEPTSYSLLALKIPKVPGIESYQSVIKHANQFLLEHSCSIGGWNHGNNLCLGVNLPPFTVTTAEALLALQDQPNHPVVKAGLAYLDKVAGDHVTAMSAAWSALAMDAYGLDVSRELNLLTSLQHPDGSFGRDLMVTGLATTALGLASGKNLLRFS